MSLAWWAMTGSNRRPSACKADALPAELIAHASTLSLNQFPARFEPLSSLTASPRRIVGVAQVL